MDEFKQICLPSLETWRISNLIGESSQTQWQGSHCHTLISHHHYKKCKKTIIMAVASMDSESFLGDKNPAVDSPSPWHDNLLATVDIFWHSLVKWQRN